MFKFIIIMLTGVIPVKMGIYNQLSFVALIPDYLSGSLRRTVQYAAFLLISRALPLDAFDQPGIKLLFQQPVRGSRKYYGNS